MTSPIDKELAALRRLQDDGRPRGKLESLCIERQINDLRTGHERGLVWDHEEADRVCRFFGMLSHWKGSEWAGRPIEWQPWQIHCVIRPLFGWYVGQPRDQKELAKGGRRRFRVGWVEIPRKNGKTTWGAACTLFGLVADGEKGAHIYAAATRKEQANILLEDAKGMIRNSDLLSQRTTYFKEVIFCESMASRFQILPHEPTKLDGLDQHFGLVDEVHAHKTREQWDVMLGGTAARTQPMQIGITTAGSAKGPQSISWELHEHARNVLEGQFTDDKFFTFIAAADASDNHRIERTWQKANPNYGITVKKKFMEMMSTQATTPLALANFKRKHLDMWVGRNLKALDVEIWRKNTAFSEDAWTDPEFQTFAAVDLGFVDDLAAVATVRPKIVPFKRLDDESEAPRQDRTPETADEEDLTPANRIESAFCRVRLFCPEHGPRDLDAEPWMTWIENGWLEVTPGTDTHVGWIYNAVADADAKWNVQSVAIDPWNARQLGGELVEYGTSHGKAEGWVNLFKQQSWAYNEPVGEFLSMIVSGRLHHDGNPMLTWMIDNLMLVTDSSGRVKPDKGKSSEKVDGAVALIMAIARAMFCDLETPVYETRGLRTL